MERAKDALADRGGAKEINFLFPFADVEKNSRIILYGAGAVGYQFYHQLQNSGYCKRVKWVDGQYEWFQYLGMPVDSPQSIIDEKFDSVVVAVEKENVYESIEHDLRQMGVDETKIVWRDNYRVSETLFAQRTVNYAEEIKRAVKMNPISLIDENRMDIVIRYIYAKAFLENRDMDRARQLYHKLIYAVNRGEEPLANRAHAYFSEYSQKNGIDEFEKSFQELIMSMKQNGFNKEHFIPIGADGKPLNGAHRMAVALALGIDVWTVKFELLQGKMLFFSYTLEWMRENRFEDAEIDFAQLIFSIMKN